VTACSPGAWYDNNPTDFESLIDDLEAEVFGKLPDQSWFYPATATTPP